MFVEILIGLLISCVLVYLLYTYLSWCSSYSGTKVIYDTNPAMVSAKDRAVLDTYGRYMLPEYLSDTYKPIRFWILYYDAWLNS